MTNLSCDQENSSEHAFSLDSSQTCRAKSSGVPRVAVIRREFVDLTGDHFSAVVLNQLLYWTQRVKDFDLLLEEERNFNPDFNVLPRHGWIYKTAYELIEETMLKASPPTMRKYLRLRTITEHIFKKFAICLYRRHLSSSGKVHQPQFPRPFT